MRPLAGLSAVIPTLNVAAHLAACLSAIAGVGEVVVVDGGSSDGTAGLAERLGARVLATRPGRGGQLAAGIAAARAPWLLLLHADTRLGPGWRAAAAAFMNPDQPDERAGYFRFALDSPHPWARRLERLVAWRSRVFGLPYGDQALLLPRGLLDQVGGMRPLPLMEDVDLVRRIGRRRLVAFEAPAVTSGERWEQEGWRRRSARNLTCLGLYFLGVPPERLARLYNARGHR
jgi:rSAM/selenodomain-associated transferase 2